MGGGISRGLALAAASAAASLALVAPSAGASVVPAWHDGGANAPTNVEFRAVATLPQGGSDPLVVAAGQGPGTGTGKEAVIYRLVGGQWVQDQLGQTGCLTDVAVTPDAAWAVGTTDQSCENTSKPLVLRFPGGGAALARPVDPTAPLDPTAPAPPQWTKLDDPTVAHLGGNAPTALALWGTEGYIGDAAGGIHQIHDGTAGPPVVAPSIEDAFDYTPHAKPINGVALTGAQAGLAVGQNDAVPAGGGRIFKLAGAGANAATTQPDAGATAAVLDVGAAGLSGGASPVAVAIESDRLWMPDSNAVWKRQRPAPFNVAGANLQAAAVSSAGGAVTSAIAGAAAPLGSLTGAVWVRNGASDTDPWTRTDSPGGAALLSDVAIVGPLDIWAVGQRGAIVRYSEITVPDPPPAGGGGSGGDTGTGTGTSTGTSPSTGTGSITYTTSSGGVTTTVVQRRTTTSTPTRRLLRNVKVRVLKGRLLISFRLLARAVVSARALRGRRLVGRTASRLMRKGLGRLVLRYRGTRPPSKLQLIVRPVRAAGST